jgi:RNA polymerase sigma-70 factor (ECF subfamily)
VETWRHTPAEVLRMGRMTHGGGGPAHDPFAQFDLFYRETYEALVRRVMAVGATSVQAEDAADEAMEYVLRHWAEIENPRAYARQAVMSNFLKIKRDDDRRQRLQEAIAMTPPAAPEHGYSVWADKETVLQILNTLSPAQRNTLALIIDGYDAAEIGELLGCTAEAVRKNLERARKRLRGQVARIHRRRSGSTPETAGATSGPGDIGSDDSEWTGGGSG